MFNLWALSSTFALRLFEKTAITLAKSVLLKYLIMFSAFVPEPDAKITIFLAGLDVDAFKTAVLTIIKGKNKWFK